MEETLQICTQESLKAGFNSRFKIFQGDISLEESRKNLIQSKIDAFGDFHGLINSAVIALKERRKILEMKEDSFDIFYHFT